MSGYDYARDLMDAHTKIQQQAERLAALEGELTASERRATQAIQSWQRRAKKAETRLARVEGVAPTVAEINEALVPVAMSESQRLRVGRLLVRLADTLRAVLTPSEAPRCSCVECSGTRQEVGRRSR